MGLNKRKASVWHPACCFDPLYRQHRIPPFRTERERDGAPICPEWEGEIKSPGHPAGSDTLNLISGSFRCAIPTPALRKVREERGTRGFELGQRSQNHEGSATRLHNITLTTYAL